MRLIDADALKARWYKINDIDEDDRGARFVGYCEIAGMIDNAPTVDAVSKDLFEQYKWERDTALETLEEHGLSLGQKRGKQMAREEAIKILKKYAPRIKPFYEPYRTEYPQAIDMAIEALQANPDRPQGEWIGVGGEPYSMCSNCERYIDDIDDDFDFCPHCGAKMQMQGEE